MILRPTVAVTEFIATVGYDSRQVTVRLSEKNEVLRGLVKNREFVWSWDHFYWWRMVTAATGPAANYAAQIGHLLLAAGFTVEVDDDVAPAILSASYTPEKRHRVGERASGDYRGWFIIIWPRDDDYWNTAKSLPGSRYDRPFLVVPPDQYEAIQDFAEQNGFWISPAAQKLIEKAAERRRNALIVEVPPLATERRMPQTVNAAGVEIDPELADDYDAV